MVRILAVYRGDPDSNPARVLMFISNLLVCVFVVNLLLNLYLHVRNYRVEQVSILQFSAIIRTLSNKMLNTSVGMLEFV